MCRLKRLNISFILLVMFLQLNNYSAVITYEFSGGRFGDNLLAYAHAKWLSFVYNIPLLYKPFDYSDQLILHKKENLFSKELRLTQKKLCIKDMVIDVNQKYCYVVPYFSEVSKEFHTNPKWIYFKVDWDNSVFKQQLKNLIYPVDKEIFNFNTPMDCFSVAVHIRMGSGPDTLFLDNYKKFVKGVNYCNIEHPLKFPPLVFYINQIRTISTFVNNKKMYVCVFTDAKNAKDIFIKIKKELKDYNNITLDLKYSANNDKTSVINDFFALTQFNAIIRPQSNFSIMAAKISDYDIEIFPVDFIKKNGLPYISKVKIINSLKSCK